MAIMSSLQGANVELHCGGAPLHEYTTSADDEYNLINNDRIMKRVQSVAGRVFMSVIIFTLDFTITPSLLANYGRLRFEIRTTESNVPISTTQVPLLDIKQMLDAGYNFIKVIFTSRKHLQSGVTFRNFIFQPVEVGKTLAYYFFKLV